MGDGAPKKGRTLNIYLNYLDRAFNRAIKGNHKRAGAARLPIAFAMVLTMAFSLCASSACALGPNEIFVTLPNGDEMTPAQFNNDPPEVVAAFRSRIFA